MWYRCWLASSVRSHPYKYSANTAVWPCASFSCGTSHSLPAAWPCLDIARKRICIRCSATRCRRFLWLFKVCIYIYIHFSFSSIHRFEILLSVGIIEKAKHLQLIIILDAARVWIDFFFVWHARSKNHKNHWFYWCQPFCRPRHVASLVRLMSRKLFEWRLIQ